MSCNIIQSFNWKLSFILFFLRLSLKALCKRSSISNKNVEGTFQDIIKHIFSMWNFLVLKWRLFYHYCNEAFLKSIIKKLWFLIQIVKIQFNIYDIAEFYDQTFSATKMIFFFQYNAGYQKKKKKKKKFLLN